MVSEGAFVDLEGQNAQVGMALVMDIMELVISNVLDDMWSYRQTDDGRRGYAPYSSIDEGEDLEPTWDPPNPHRITPLLMSCKLICRGGVRLLYKEISLTSTSQYHRFLSRPTLSSYAFCERIGFMTALTESPGWTKGEREMSYILRLMDRFRWATFFKNSNAQATDNGQLEGVVQCVIWSQDVGVRLPCISMLFPEACLDVRNGPPLGCTLTTRKLLEEMSFLGCFNCAFHHPEGSCPGKPGGPTPRFMPKTIGDIAGDWKISELHFDAKSPGSLGHVEEQRTFDGLLHGSPLPRKVCMRLHPGMLKNHLITANTSHPLLYFLHLTVHRLLLQSDEINLLAVQSGLPHFFCSGGRRSEYERLSLGACDKPCVLAESEAGWDIFDADPAAVRGWRDDSMKLFREPSASAA